MYKPDYDNRELIPIRFGIKYLLLHDRDISTVYTIKFFKGEHYKNSIKVESIIEKYRESSTEIGYEDHTSSTFDFSTELVNEFHKNYYFPYSMSVLENDSFNVPAFCVVGKRNVRSILFGIEQRESLGYQFLLLNSKEHYNYSIKEFENGISSMGNFPKMRAYLSPKKDLYGTEFLERTGLKF